MSKGLVLAWHVAHCQAMRWSTLYASLRIRRCCAERVCRRLRSLGEAAWCVRPGLSLKFHPVAVGLARDLPLTHEHQLQPVGEPPIPGAGDVGCLEAIGKGSP